MHDLRIDDHYRSQVMLTESCEPFSPTIRGGFSFAEPQRRRPVQPTCNTISVAT